MFAFSLFAHFHLSVLGTEMVSVLDWRTSYNQSPVSHSFFCVKSRLSSPIWWIERSCLPLPCTLQDMFFYLMSIVRTSVRTPSNFMFLQLGISNRAQYSNSSHKNVKQGASKTSLLLLLIHQGVTVHLYVSNALGIDANTKKVADKIVVLFPRIAYRPLHTKNMHLFQEQIQFYGNRNVFFVFCLQILCFHLLIFTVSRFWTRQYINCIYNINSKNW